MSLSPIEVNYCELTSAYDSPPPEGAPLSMYLDVYSQSPWLSDADSPDPLTEVFPSDEAMMETMSLEYIPWSNRHHHSSFMLGLGAMSNCLEHFSSQVPSQIGRAHV